jgi:catechol 2,3-dioxygenase
VTATFGIQPPRFRLPDGTKVGAVRLLVAALQRSIDYYEQVVGARVVRRTADSAVLAAHGDDRPLIWLHARDDVKPVPSRRTYGLYHFALLLPDRHSLGRFAAHLGRMGIRVGTADHDVSESFYLSDPDGLGIEVYADRPRSEWHIQGRELVMTVDPLDVPGLIAEAGHEPWTGLPPGSTVGHMHLHVGDLDIAEAFYHRAIGFDKVVWSFPGALFLSAGGYHHHLGTNTWAPGPAPADDQARLLEWELLVPDGGDAAAAASLSANGYAAQAAHDGWVTADPWGTSLRIRAA